LDAIAGLLRRRIRRALPGAMTCDIIAAKTGH
jgi:hypothetical protein